MYVADGLHHRLHPAFHSHPLESGFFGVERFGCCHLEEVATNIVVVLNVSMVFLKLLEDVVAQNALVFAVFFPPSDEAIALVLA